MRTSNDVVPNAGQVADPSAANEHDGVFLQVVSFPANVGGDFLAVGKADASDFSQSRVRLFGSYRPHLETYPSFLGGFFQITHFGLGLGGASGFSYKLIDRWHTDSYSG